MVKITYITHDGIECPADVEPGLSLMEGAVWNDIRGIYGNCGGDGGCATCHVYVDSAWIEKIGLKSSKERNTLRFALNVHKNSRLSCFIKVVDELDGLVVQMPKRQF